MASESEEEVEITGMRGAATAALAFFVPMHEPHISPISCLYLVSCRGSQRVTDEKHIETL